MIAKRSRTVFPNKVDVQSESDQVASKGELEQPLPSSTQAFRLENDPDNNRPITTQSLIEKPQQNNEKVKEGRSKASKRNYEGAIEDFNSVLPATFDSLYYRGCARLELGDRLQIYNAIDDFNQALQLSQVPNNPDIYYKRAFAYQMIGQYAEAVFNYSLFIQYNKIPDVHKGYLSRGLVYNDLKQYDKALDDIEYANKTGPKPNMYYMYCLARTQAFIGRHNDAKTTYNGLVNICRNEHSLSKQTFYSHFYYGVAAYELNDYSTAHDQLNQALNYRASDGELAETRFFIGLTYYTHREIELAKINLREALNLDKNHTRALFHLGMIESQNEDLYSEALGYLTKAHELTPHKSDILYERGELHHKMGHLDACVRDKQLALQLEHTNVDASAVKHYCELIIQQLLAKIKQSKPTDDMRLMLLLLYDKIHISSHDIGRSSIFDKKYRRMILMYEQEIETEEKMKGNYSPIYFALLCNLHKNHKHPGAAMIALDQLHDKLDKSPELDKKWQQMLHQIREMVTKQSASEKENFQNLLEIAKSQESSQSNNSEQTNMLLIILSDRILELEKIEKTRNQVKVDQQHFANDLNKNRSIFHHKMRVSLSHKFTAMAVTSSGEGDEPIVKHDVTGTETMIAQGICILGDTLGAAMPNGGGIVSAVSSIVGSQLQQHEYDRYQDRMALVTDVGSVEELTDVARQVARQLADRYKEQLLRLRPRPEEVPVVCCSCCIRCGCCKKDDSSVKARPTKSIHPAEQVAQFGVVFAVQSIIHGELDNIEFSDDTKCEDLAKVLTKLICSAKPTNIKSKILRRMNLDKNANLPYTPFENTKQGEKSTKWHLHDFYQKPGIFFEEKNGEESKQNPLSWMNPDLYGYRLGTLEEYNDLVELDKKEAASNSCC